jgi:hypothetical protein
LSVLKYRHLKSPHDRLECAYLYYYATDVGIQGASSAMAVRTDDDSALSKRIEALTQDAMIEAKAVGERVLQSAISWDLLKLDLSHNRLVLMSSTP